MTDIAERVKKIVVEHLGVAPEKAVAGARIVDDLGADSLDIAELATAFEEEFGLEIPNDVAGKWQTFDDVVKFIATVTIA